MKTRTWWTPIALLALAVPVACSESTKGSGGDDDDTPAEAHDGGHSDAAAREADAASSPDASGEGRIGELRDKGVKTVNPSEPLSSRSSWTCAEVCEEAGGVCEDDAGRGAGYAYGRYTDGSGTFDSRVSSCEDPESSSSTWQLTALDCYCDGMDVPPTVRVKRSEGYYSCSDVCESWDLACDADRQSVAYTDEAESDWSEIECDEAPNDGMHHYVCACQ